MTEIQEIERDVLALQDRLGLRPTLDLAVQIGERLAQAKTMLRHGQWLPWLARMGLRPRTAQVYIQVSNAQAPAHLQEPITIDGFLRIIRTGFAAHLSPHAGSPEWYTPDEYLEAARQVLGGIDLDPASSAIAQRRVRAKRFYTASQNGLSRKWQGKVWLNPPYTSEIVGQFTAKLCAHYKAGDVPEALLLVNNATETHWFQDAANLATAFCFPRGRIRFLDGNGQAGPPLQGQAILYFGRNRKHFEKAFAPFGFCR